MQSLRMTVSDLFTPAIMTVSKPFHAVTNFISGVSGIAEMRAENARLEAENIRLRDWYQKALMLQSENQSLRDLLNFEVEAPHKTITTRVVSDPGNSFVHSILIAAGQDDGVKKANAVLAGDGLLGRIIETGKSSARVLLITDYNSRIPVLIEGSLQKAILVGDNSTQPVLKYFPSDAEIQSGMRIVTSGHGGVFPPGLPVGTIVKRGEGAFAVKPFADVAKITHVRVIDYDRNPNLRRASFDNDF